MTLQKRRIKKEKEKKEMKRKKTSLLSQLNKHEIEITIEVSVIKIKWLVLSQGYFQLSPL